ncbi:ABC transporter substrate-binding protein [Rossellomorea marisflavi]
MDRAEDGNVDREQEKVINLSMIYAGGEPTTKNAISNVVAGFMEENPNIFINEYTSGSENYLDYIRTKDAVGEFPDIIEMRDTELFAKAGMLTELPPEITKKFESVAEIDGKVYTAPLTGQGILGVFYNKALFERAGIKEIPRTYEEFLEVCEELKNNGSVPLVVGARDSWHLGFLINNFIINYVFSEEPDWLVERREGNVRWTDKEPKKAMEEMLKIFNNNYINQDYKSTQDYQTATIFANEGAAMLFSGPWKINHIRKENPELELGWFPLPYQQGELSITGGVTQEGWAISSETSKDDEKYNAAKKFIEYFFAEENYSTFLSNVYGMPSISEELIYEKDEIANEMLSTYYDPNVEKALMINQYWGDKRVPTEFRDFFYRIMSKVIEGDVSLDEALKDVDEKWDERQLADGNG